MKENDRVLIIVIPVEPILTALQAIQQSIEALPDKTGRSTAKWLEAANSTSVRGELLEDVFSSLGFKPVEIVDRLYPNMSKSARRAKAKAISERLKR